MLLNALTVDVEDWFHANALSAAAPRERWDGLESRVVANTQRLLDLFERRQVRGTFFVLGWVAERMPELVRQIDRAGHEVACHGYSHQLVFRQSRDEFRAETLRAKALLEDATGKAVRGYRASTYSITAASTWALDVLVEAGFDYDSSIFPIRHDVYGYPEAQRWPGRLATPGGGTIVEFPMTTAEVAGLRLPVCGGDISGSFPTPTRVSGLDASMAAIAVPSCSISIPGRWTRSSRVRTSDACRASAITPTSIVPRRGSSGCCRRSASTAWKRSWPASNCCHCGRQPDWLFPATSNHEATATGYRPCQSRRKAGGPLAAP